MVNYFVLLNNTTFLAKALLTQIYFYKINPTRFGVSLGADDETYTLSKIGVAFIEGDVHHSIQKGDFSYFERSNYLGQIWAVRRSAHVQSSILSILYNTQGPMSVSSTACASSTQAIGKAMRMIEHDDADIMIAGGTDSFISEFSVAGFALLGALSQNNENPEKASRPFDLKRDGFVIGEGAGILILEELNHARERSATILAELTGFGTSSNAYRMTDSPPDGRGADQAMWSALQDAGLLPEDIDYVPNEPREYKIDTVLSNSFAFGGHNASLVVEWYQEVNG